MVSNHTVVSLNETMAQSASCVLRRCRPRICLMGASFETDNLGVNALTSGALAAVLAQYPDANLRILEYGINSPQYHFKLRDKVVPVETLNVRFSKNPLLRNHIVHLIVLALAVKVLYFHSMRARLLSRNPWLSELSRVDVALALGGGDSFSDIYGVIRFFYVCLPQILLLLLGKQLLLLPQTIGPFKRKSCELVAKFVLARAATVYSRDEQAVEQVRKLVPAAHAAQVKFCFDVGFAVTAVRPRRCDPPLAEIFAHRPVVGMNISGLLYVGGYTHGNMFGLTSDYKEIVHDLARTLLVEKGATVLLIPHVFGTVESDLPACEEIYNKLHNQCPGRLFLLKPPYDEHEVKHVIGLCDFFVGSRMHSCIAALSQSVPAAGLAYSDKFRGVLRSVGMESAVVDLRILSRNEVIATTCRVYEARRSLRLALRQRMPVVERAVLELFQDIKL